MRGAASRNNRRTEPFGHALSGICLAQALRPTEPREPAWFWPAIGAIAATMPDVDSITYLAGPDAFQRYHQFYTHNLIAFALAPPLLALGARRVARTDPPLARLLSLCWGGMALHLLGDTIAHWPLRLFWPFSRQGIAFELIHRDFSVVLPFLLLFGAGLSFANELQRFRRVIAIATLVAAVAYVLVGPGW